MAERVTRCRPLLGTFVEITADTPDAIEAAFGAVERVHGLMSLHEPQSDISRVNRFAHFQRVEVDDWTTAVLERAIHWSAASGGLFDIVRAGKAAIDRGLLPRHSDQPQPQLADWTSLKLEGRTVRLAGPVCIDLGGIAKGYAIDAAVAALKGCGASHGLVNAGGDMAGFGAQPWPVQVVEPRTRRAIANVALVNGAVATSSILPDGSGEHLVGRARHLVSATVSAPTAMDADSLTKILLTGSPIAASCLEAANAHGFVVHECGNISQIRPEMRAA
jgi:FAD:protein FMN transferase